jgi:hypothetical protein
MKNPPLSLKETPSSLSSSLSSFLSSLDILGSKVGVTFEDLAIRHMWEPRDDEEESLEALINILSWTMEYLFYSTLLDTQQLEEVEIFVSWKQDKSSISS